MQSGKARRMEQAGEELGLNGRALSRRIPVQGARDRRREGNRDGSVSTGISAARNLSPCLAVRSGSTKAGTGHAVFPLAAGEHSDGLTFAPRAGPCILACPRPRGTAGPVDSTPGLCKRRQKCWRAEEEGWQQTCEPAESWLPASPPGLGMVQTSEPGILLAATSQHGLPSLCQCWKHQALLLFVPVQAARHKPAPAGCCPALLGREGGCSQPAQRPARGPGLPIPAVPLGDISWAPWKRCRVGAATRGVSHAAEGGSLARLALATTRPPRAAVTVTRGTGTGCPQGVASPAAG